MTGHTAHTAAVPAPTHADPAGQPPTPSAGWTSPDRPELSPEHVALLTWWADMISKGQFPAPDGPGAPVAQDQGSFATVQGSTDARQRRTTTGRRRNAKMVALSLTVVAVAGLALVFGQKVLSAATADPAPVPATELAMPATVGDLVAVTGPEVGAQLVPVLGFGVRPAGVTVTGAYGTDPAGPVALAAMTTTVETPADAAGQLTAWAERTGATISDPLPGSGTTAGVTCAEVTENPVAPIGSVCVWTATGMRGQTYVVGTSPDAALQTTAEARAAMPAPAAG
jgi:hypothetical protein